MFEVLQARGKRIAREGEEVEAGRMRARERFIARCFMCEQLTLTNCTTAYPTPPITTLINTYSCQLLERGGGGGGRGGRAGGIVTSI